EVGDRDLRQQIFDVSGVGQHDALQNGGGVFTRLLVGQFGDELFRAQLVNGRLVDAPLKLFLQRRLQVGKALEADSLRGTDDGRMADVDQFGNPRRRQIDRFHAVRQQELGDAL